MSTDLSLQIQSTDSKTTELIAANIGKKLVGGEVIELSSDLGGGKTTFTKGLVKGAGSLDLVASPTFTISKIYNADGKNIFHFDFYRLENAGIMKQEIQEVLEDKTNIVILEWANIINDVLPEDRVRILFEVSSENERQLNISYPKTLEYLFIGLSK